MERILYFTNIGTKAFINNSSSLITENQQDRVNDVIEIRKICKVSIGKKYIGNVTHMKNAFGK